MKILVTGGCGFIGSHIVDAYVNLGHRVVVIDDLSTGDIRNLNPEATLYEQDICDEAVEKIFKKEKFDVVNHHAAQINVRKSVADPLYDARVNIIGSLNLINLAARHGIRRFIFASSGGALYGEPEHLPINERSPLDPLSPYAVSKITTEKYLVTFARTYNFDYVILRYSNVYGPRQIHTSEAGVISIFINQLLNRQPCTIFGNGNQTRDYVYVGDVVEANILGLECSSNVFNIGTAIETSVNDLITVLSDITKNEVVCRHDDPRIGEVYRNVLDCSKARSAINWSAKMPLPQGIRETYQYFSHLHANT
jgi:UDP-glucose 4-epimerase